MSKEFKLSTVPGKKRIAMQCYSRCLVSRFPASCGHQPRCPSSHENQNYKGTIYVPIPTALWEDCMAGPGCVSRALHCIIMAVALK